MKVLHRVVRLTALALAAGGAFARAADNPPPPTEPELRAALGRSLSFLAREGDQWMTEKNCNSCHHLPELLWSHREAGRRGFAIDPQKFGDWLAWADEHAMDKKAGLEEAALMILALPQRPAPDLVKLLVDNQKPDGTWSPANQFATMQRRGAPDAQANCIRQSLIALATAQQASPESGAAGAKAAAILQKLEKPSSTDSFVFQTLYARRFGPPAEEAALRAELLKLQRGDGGWSSLIGANLSDALATGQVLYALQTPASDPSDAAAIARAQRWLLKAQRTDGSWPIDISHISKVDRSAPAKAKSLKEATGIYVYWAAGWATIGLLQGVPPA